MKLICEIMFAACVLGMTQNGFAKSHVLLKYGAMTLNDQPPLKDYSVTDERIAEVRGIGADISVKTTGTLHEYRDPSPKHTSYGFQFVFPFYLGIGVNRSTDIYTTTFKATSNLVTVLKSSGTPIIGYAYSGDILAYKDVNFTGYCADLSLTIPIKALFLNMGAGMPVYSKSVVKMRYTPTTQVLLGTLEQRVVGEEESLKIVSDSAYALFANLGFSIGHFELFAGFRSDYIKSHVDLSASPLKWILGSTKPSSENRTNSIVAGVGFNF